MLRYADDWALPFSCFASFLFFFLQAFDFRIDKFWSPLTGFQD